MLMFHPRVALTLTAVCHSKRPDSTCPGRVESGIEVSAHYRGLRALVLLRREISKISRFMNKPIKSALISVFYKDGLEIIVKKLHQLGVTIYSTGGTQQFIEKQGIPCVPVESLTSYPSILGGRVKTLHPSDIRRHPWKKGQSHGHRGDDPISYSGDRPGDRGSLPL